MVKKMKKITRFGKELRKLRIDLTESLGQMAKKTGISTSYLSAIELGHKEVPEGFVNKVGDVYSLTDENIKYLFESIYKDAKRLNVEIEGDENMKDLAAGFARMAGTDDYEKRKQISKDLKQRLEAIFG